MWLPVHIRDMLLLKERHPREYVKFQKGHFAVHKTSHQFSAIAFDHTHEQMNAIIKGQGGTISLTENNNALRRWLIPAPEVARIIDKYEATLMQ